MESCACVPLGIGLITHTPWLFVRGTQGGKLDVAKYLLSHSAAVNEPCADESRVTPLYMAAQLDNPLFVSLLLRHGGDPQLGNQRTGSTALLFAAERGYLRVCELLVNAGADVNAGNKYVAPCWCVRRTAECHAALLGSGCRVGRTPLHAACWHNHADVAKLLLHHGASVAAVSYKASGWRWYQQRNARGTG